MACERTSERVATLASRQMNSRKKNARSVAASALRARRKPNSRRMGGR